MTYYPNTKSRLLIADDEPEIRSVLEDLLSLDYECTVVSCAEDALECLREEKFQLVISDIMMGGMSGLEMVPKALEMAPDTAVIMISGTQTIESAIEAMRAGAFDYVMKPFDLPHVEAAVKRALEHHKLLAAKRQYENFLEELVTQRTADLDRTLHSLEGSYRQTLKALAAALETRDAETHGHSARVCAYSMRLAKELKLDADQLRDLEFGALLHDIGKIGVPDAILRKPGKLTDEEWVRMKEHPALGQQILRGINFLDGALKVVGQHHEYWNGTGYPNHMAGDEIDLNARIFAVADAYDAMTSDRVYRAGRPHEAAVEELIRCVGTQFDPAVVAAFTRVESEEWQYIKMSVPLTADEKISAESHMIAEMVIASHVN